VCLGCSGPLRECNNPENHYRCMFFRNNQASLVGSHQLCEGSKVTSLGYFSEVSTALQSYPFGWCAWGCCSLWWGSHIPCKPLQGGILLDKFVCPIFLWICLCCANHFGLWSFFIVDLQNHGSHFYCLLLSLSSHLRCTCSICSYQCIRHRRGHRFHK
jgi:hypothetical protein